MIFFFEPVRKFMFCPNISGQLIFFGTYMNIIGRCCIAGKVVWLSVKAKGEESLKRIGGRSFPFSLNTGEDISISMKILLLPH